MELGRSVVSCVRLIFCAKQFRKAIDNDDSSRFSEPVIADNWSHLSGPVMDCLIAQLKRIGRWRIDGPNLRCVNKHWRDQIDSRITHVHPLGTIKFPSMSLERLSKMSNVRHLRLDPFLPKRGFLETRRRFKAQMNCLRTMTNLTHLEFRGDISRYALLYSSECFQNVTSVVFNQVPCVKRQPVLPLRSSPIRQLTFIGKPYLQYLNYSCSDTLRSLNLKFESESPISLGRLTQLASLTSLSISSKTGGILESDSSEMLSYMTSLVSLHLPNTRIECPTWITSLSNLESLVLKICEYDKHEERIWTLLKCLSFLRSVGIMHRLINMDYFLDFYINATNLRSLEYLILPHFYNIGVSMFTQLTRLRVKFDMTNASLMRIFQLPLLEESFIDGWLLGYPPPSQNSILCKSLFVLETCSESFVHDLDIVTCLKSLKKLCLYEFPHISFSAISKFSVLPNLKELCLCRVSCHEDIEYTSESQVLFEKLDLLCIIYWNKPFDTSWLRVLLPHVKIVDNEEDFYNLSRIGTKSPSAPRYFW